jgi:hypothetical protein
MMGCLLLLFWYQGSLHGKLSLKILLCLGVIESGAGIPMGSCDAVRFEDLLRSFSCEFLCLTRIVYGSPCGSGGGRLWTAWTIK